jgi:hypothetical protein
VADNRLLLARSGLALSDNGLHVGPTRIADNEAVAFAPSVLEETVKDWFEEGDDVPFRMQVFQVREDRMNNAMGPLRATHATTRSNIVSRAQIHVAPLRRLLKVFPLNVKQTADG